MSLQEAQAEAATALSFRRAEYRSRAELRDKLRTSNAMLRLALANHVPAEMQANYRVEGMED